MTMESCIQDIQIIRAALKRRQDLFRNKGVPVQAELFDRHGQVMGDIILNGMTHVAKELMDVGRENRIPTKNLWISPEARLKREICVTEASNIDKIKALTHCGILQIGTDIERRYEAKFLKILKNAIEETSQFERFECEKRLKFALKVQQDIYMDKLNGIEDRIREKCDEEKKEMQEMYDEKYGEALCDVIKTMHEKYQKGEGTDGCGQSAIDQKSEICVSSTSMDTPSSLRKSSESFPSLPTTPEEQKADILAVDAARKLWNDFEYHLRAQKNLQACSNASDLVHFICTQKLDTQRRLDELKRQCCQKIELLKSYLFDICCKVRCMECQCPPEEIKPPPKPICLSAKYCRCEHRQTCINNNGVEQNELICSCCGKEIDNKTCGGKDPKLERRNKTCTCPVEGGSNQNNNAKTKNQPLDAKLFCCCNQGNMEEEMGEEMVDKKLCCVCRAKQICEIVGNMKWPTPPKPPCICSERKDESIPCNCNATEGNKDQFSKQDEFTTKNKNEITHMSAAFVMPEYIGKQIYCECQSSSSSESEKCFCPDDDNTKNKDENVEKLKWTPITENDCIQLKDPCKTKICDDRSSINSSSPTVSTSKVVEISGSSSSRSTHSTHSRYSCKEFKEKIKNELDPKEIVEYIFLFSTDENLKDPEYIKRRLEEEFEKKLEEILIPPRRSKEKRKSKSTTSSSSKHSTTSIMENEQFVGDLLEVKRQRKLPPPCGKPIRPQIPDNLLPEDIENKFDQTTHETWKTFVHLPKYLVPVASLFDGSWSYKQTSDKEWKALLALIENEEETAKCFNKN